LAIFLIQIFNAHYLDDDDDHLAVLTVLASLQSYRFRYSTESHGFFESVFIKQLVVSKNECPLAERTVRLVEDQLTNEGWVGT